MHEKVQQEQQPNIIVYVMKKFITIACRLWSFVLVGISFILFVKWNGGIVLGDKSNHIAMAHVPQIFYFITFTVCLAPFTILLKGGRLLYDTVKRHLLAIILMSSVVIPAIAYLCYRFSYAHKFLLSDNRHYTFYLMRKLFKIHISDQVMRQWQAMYAPLYLICSLVLFMYLKGM